MGNKPFTLEERICTFGKITISWSEDFLSVTAPPGPLNASMRVSDFIRAVDELKKEEKRFLSFGNASEDSCLIYLSRYPSASDVHIGLKWEYGGENDVVSYHALKRLQAFLTAEQVLAEKGLVYSVQPICQTAQSIDFYVGWAAFSDREKTEFRSGCRYAFSCKISGADAQLKFLTMSSASSVCLDDDDWDEKDACYGDQLLALAKSYVFKAFPAVQRIIVEPKELTIGQSHAWYDKDSEQALNPSLR